MVLPFVVKVGVTGAAVGWQRATNLTGTGQVVVGAGLGAPGVEVERAGLKQCL